MTQDIKAGDTISLMMRNGLNGYIYPILLEESGFNDFIKGFVVYSTDYYKDTHELAGMMIICPEDCKFYTTTDNVVYHRSTYSKFNTSLLEKYSNTPCMYIDVGYVLPKDIWHMILTDAFDFRYTKEYTKGIVECVKSWNIASDLMINTTATIPKTPIAQAAIQKESSPTQDGCVCKVCKDFYHMAVPNQEDGTLICYGCRQ